MKVTETINGAYVLYSWVNQAYFLMWFDQVLRIFNEKEEALQEFRRITE